MYQNHTVVNTLYEIRKKLTKLKGICMGFNSLIRHNIKTGVSEVMKTEP
jgi:hypothetical protein